jgi:hypothetical protein
MTANRIAQTSPVATDIAALAPFRDPINELYVEAVKPTIF